MRDAIVGIDIGTSSIKAVLFDVSGSEVASASQAYPFLTPQPGWVEQDPELVWQALLLVLASLAKVTGQAPGYRILALALAAQGGSIIPADSNGDPVYPMITWLDTRCNAMMKQWYADGTADTVAQLSGWHPFPGLPLPSIAWLRANRPDIHAASACYLGPADFLIRRLTGRLATDLSAAAEMLLVDINDGRWNEELCALGGVQPAAQAELGWAGRVIGAVKDEVASVTGLAAGTPVVAGGMDQVCASMAMGNILPGRFMLSTGTAWTITGTVERPDRTVIPPGLNVSFHVVTNRWTVTQYIGGFGAIVDWWLQQAWQSLDPAAQYEKGQLYGYLDQALATSTPGSHNLLFLPLSAQVQVPDGLPATSYVGLELSHTRADMSRAILEGCACEVRWFLEDLRSAGMAVDELWVSGGATASSVWPQILADVGGVPIVVANYASWAALGGAILAGWGAGVYASLEAGIAALRPPVRRILPDPSLSPLYTERFGRYQRVAIQLTGVQHRLLQE
jgi:xylulokinase